MLLAAVAVTLLAALYGYGVREQLSVGGVEPTTSESARGSAWLTAHFAAGLPQLVLIADAAGPVDGERAAAEGRRLTGRLAADPAVAHVTSYWSGASRELRSADGRGGLILVQLHGREQRQVAAAERLAGKWTGCSGPLRVTAAGAAMVRVEFQRQAERDQERAEVFVVPLVALLLLFGFRSAVAAALPLVIGVVSVIATSAVMRALCASMQMSVYAWNIAVALGFGLAVDYSLFLVSRYREELAQGAPVPGAVRTAMRTAGRTVAFSAGVVGLPMAALLLVPIPVLRSIAAGGLAAAALTAATTLLILPALLTVLGERVHRFDVFGRWRRRPRPGGDGRGELSRWGRCAAAVMRHPLRFAVPVLVLLAVFVAPLSGVRFGLFDDRSMPAGSAIARASATLRADYPAYEAVSNTTVALPGLDPVTRKADLDRYAHRISGLDGVLQVRTADGVHVHGGPFLQSRRESAVFGNAHGTWLSVSTADRSPGPESGALARRVRALPSPVPALVSGPGARLADVQQAIGHRLPYVLALVVLAITTLILALTRHPVLVLKALVLNVLSMAAAFGALVHIFQRGHLRFLVGDFTATGTFDALQPILVFCVVFGLSMDYELFLLSRIVEEYRNTGSTREAVVRGMDRTASLFTLAAATLAVVTSALATSDLVVLKFAGVGTALAVLLDATVIRGLLLPAVMQLVGRANWWTPALLRRREPKAGTAGPVDPTTA
ncbi:MMPL family transporter [Streptomyces hiroshimensis]|uniref:Membrane protein n=1 Tax=Streptomyces hiroshimensis TaxID=66424 RepID=A0ABQ2Z292_9ACTN|nr:MMPL family transporter [Streptomyces hiroshimensis]GGY02582.1 membrane protein [Streptomyces hiroshimensis]